MALWKLATDGLINGLKNSHKLEQSIWRGNNSNKNYGQVLRGGVRPNDQSVDGPVLPNNPNVDARIDVYEGPDGFGWIATFEAEENPGAVRWFRTLSVHMDGPIVESAWALVPEPVTI